MTPLRTAEAAKQLVIRVGRRKLSAHSQDLLKGGYRDVCSLCMHAEACKTRGGKLFEIRRSENASEGILGQKNSRSSYMVRGVLHPNFGCPRMHLLCQLTLNFHERRY